MVYNNCGFCNYQVSESEKYCPNCGFKNPWKIKRKWELERYNEERINAIRNEGSQFKALTLALSAIFTLSSAFFFFLFSLSGFSLLSVISGFSAFLSGFGVLGFFIYYQTTFEFKNKRKDRYLINEEKMIYKRIKEIYEKKEKINHVQTRIHRSEGKKDLVRTLSILSESKDHLEQYEKRFYIELKKIKLIRWRNKFKPIVSEWHKPGYEEGEQFLDKLDIIIEQGKKLFSTWSQDQGFLEGNDVKTLINQIKSDLDVLFHLQKSLLTRQAQLSIQDIRPIETEQMFRKQAITFQSYIKKSTEYITAYSFIKAFEELEYEYIRFQSEKDVLGE